MESSNILLSFTTYNGFNAVCSVYAIPQLFTQLISLNLQVAKELDIQQHDIWQGTEDRQGHSLLQEEYAIGLRFRYILYQGLLTSHAELVGCCCHDPGHNVQDGIMCRATGLGFSRASISSRFQYVARNCHSNGGCLRRKFSSIGNPWAIYAHHSWFRDTMRHEGTLLKLPQ